MGALHRIGWFSIFCFLLEVSFILIFTGFMQYDDFYNGSKWNETHHPTYKKPNLHYYYAMFQDVHVMILVGFGFLMTFLKKYAFSSVSINLVLTSVTIQYAIIIMGFFFTVKDGIITLSMLDLLNGDLASGTVLISMGAVLGKTTPTQLVCMILIEVVVFAGNLYFGMEVLGVFDIGGSIFIHTFGAYFGLGVAKTVSRNLNVIDHPKEGSSYNSDLFAMVGTVFLWVFWPSFNGILASEEGQGRAVINTYLGLVSATVTACVVSGWQNKKNKWTMAHVQNATLAGGVAVGAVADLMIFPWGALVIGSFAGIVSCLGYIYITPLLANRIGIHDTCGVHNLHGMPGIISALVSVVASFFASETYYGLSLYTQFPRMAPAANTTALRTLQGLHPEIEAGEGRSASMQALMQALGTLVTLIVAFLSGLVTGEERERVAGWSELS
ncbi:ammonium transporter Rh type B-like [Oratosquilla oratoria]|uniref:ammonium transporter Rh type B-like n=1 Tax=Oratosquilla oratoria TaxID=337810 RepID=UPI003F76060F